jgi:hypothetical protein
MDPQRFDEGDATEFERQLFEAAHRQVPSAALKARMQQGLGFAAAPVAAPVVAKSLALSWKLGAFLGLAAIGTVATVSVVERRGRPALSAEKSPDSSRPPLVGEAVVAPGSLDAPPKSNGAIPSEESALMAEIHLLDGARAALAGGEPRRALGVLDHYDREHAQGRFRPEAIALRIQALYAAGDEQAARSLGQKFLADYPTNPLAARVAKLLRR